MDEAESAHDFRTRGFPVLLEAYKPLGISYSAPLDNSLYNSRELVTLPEMCVSSDVAEMYHAFFQCDLRYMRDIKNNARELLQVRPTWVYAGPMKRASDALLILGEHYDDGIVWRTRDMPRHRVRETVNVMAMSLMCQRYLVLDPAECTRLLRQHELAVRLDDRDVVSAARLAAAANSVRARLPHILVARGFCLKLCGGNTKLLAGGGLREYLGNLTYEQIAGLERTRRYLDRHGRQDGCGEMLWCMARACWGKKSASAVAPACDREIYLSRKRAVDCTAPLSVQWPASRLYRSFWRWARAARWQSFQHAKKIIPALREGPDQARVSGALHNPARGCYAYTAIDLWRDFSRSNPDACSNLTRCGGVKRFTAYMYAALQTSDEVVAYSHHRATLMGVGGKTEIPQSSCEAGAQLLMHKHCDRIASMRWNYEQHQMTGDEPMSYADYIGSALSCTAAPPEGDDDDDDEELRVPESKRKRTRRK